jgi:mannose-6-phosphate isomerase-like protein (cupin superfamily)
MIFLGKQASLVKRTGFTAHLYMTGGYDLPFSAVFVDCFGEHERVVVAKSVRTYFVISGKIRFEIDGTESDCHQGDLAVIPRGIPYSYSGRGTMFEMNIPPTGPSDESPAARNR